MNRYKYFLAAVLAFSLLINESVMAEDLNDDTFVLEEFPCMLEPNDEVDISSQISGILDKVFVKRGDIVKKGQILATLKSGAEKIQVELARARVDYAKRKSSRNEELYDKELISVHEKDEIETEIEIGELELKEAEELLALRTIRSTVNGVVVDRLLSPGEYIGEQSVLKIVRINPLNVEVVLPVSRLRSVKVGMTGSVMPEEPVGGLYKAKVVIVDRVVDAASGTFRVRLKLQNRSFKIPSGLKCMVSFSDSQQKTVKNN